MAFVDQNQINEIREKANIVDVIGDYLPLTQKGKNFFGVCPFHDDHAPSMSVSTDRQIFKCFSCGASGNVFTFVMDYENISFLEAVALVASKVGISIINQNNIPKQENKHQDLFKITDLVSKYFQNNLKTSLGANAKEYLHKRNINDNDILEFNIGLSLKDKNALTNLLLKKGYEKKELYDLSLITENGDMFINRIIFPIHDTQGNIVGFSGRQYNDNYGSKYVNSRESIIFKKSEILYNYHRAKLEAKKLKQIIVVEGFMDAIRLSINGIKNVVAIMGTSLTDNHVDILKKLRVKVILCLDNDNAGFSATYLIGEALEKSNIEVEVIRLTDEKDPDDYITKKGINAFIDNLKKPIKFFDYKLEYFKNNKNLNSTNDLATYINDVLKSLSKEKDEILISITLEKISKEYNIDIEVLKNKLNKVTDKKELVKKEEKIEKTIEKQLHNKYDTAARRIIYFMMNSPTYIIMFKKHVGFINKYEYRTIVNDILYYYDENKTITLADFITYVSYKENEILLVKSIINECSDLELSDTEMLNYLKVLREGNYLSEIENLKKKLKEEMDHNKKIEIANKITKLKKGSVENG